MIKIDITAICDRSSMTKSENKDNIKHLARLFPDLLQWICTSFCGKFLHKDFILQFILVKRLDELKCLFCILVFTLKNEYSISGAYSMAGHINTSRSYLGCINKSRNYLVGENWHRGSDLADGKYCKLTWNLIVQDIMSMLLLQLLLRNNKPIVLQIP